jgi:hypothetical protein
MMRASAPIFHVIVLHTDGFDLSIPDEMVEDDSRHKNSSEKARHNTDA